MSSNLYRVGYDLTQDVRDSLLRTFRPRHALVYCRNITWIYGCSADFEDFPKQPMACVIVGHHIGPDHEALVITLDDQATRPDGKLHHITLSVAPGVPPARAGEIDPAFVVDVEPWRVPLFYVPLFRSKVRRLVPQPLGELQFA
jgi:hypothetical protein